MELLNIKARLEELKKNTTKTKARTYLEEIAWRYIPQLSWTNETFFSDYTYFWSACAIYNRRHTAFQFESLMRWAGDKGVHPRALCKLLKK